MKPADEVAFAESDTMQDDSTPVAAGRLRALRPDLHGQNYGPGLQNIYGGRFLGGVMPVLRYGFPRHLLYFLGGIGDDLLCTTVLHELRQRGHRGLWMMTRYRELFYFNQDVDAVMSIDWRYPTLTRRLGGTVSNPVYTTWDKASDRDDVPPRHILSYMCELVGMSGKVSLRPYFFLADEERAAGQIVSNQVIIQSSGMGATYPMLNKEWYPERFQEIVTRLKGRYNFVQIGKSNDPPLEGALDLRGKTSIRELASLLSRSLAFVGLVGFVMHLARAVDCRSVIVYGGRESPDQTGYCANANLFLKLSCSPCWRWNHCDFERECMKAITPQVVMDALETQVALHGTPLVIGVDEIPGSGQAGAGPASAQGLSRGLSMQSMSPQVPTVR